MSTKAAAGPPVQTTTPPTKRSRALMRLTCRGTNRNPSATSGGPLPPPSTPARSTRTRTQPDLEAPSPPPPQRRRSRPHSTSSVADFERRSFRRNTLLTDALGGRFRMEYAPSNAGVLKLTDVARDRPPLSEVTERDLYFPVIVEPASDKELLQSRAVGLRSAWDTTVEYLLARCDASDTLLDTVKASLLRTHSATQWPPTSE